MEVYHDVVVHYRPQQQFAQHNMDYYNHDLTFHGIPLDRIDIPSVQHIPPQVEYPTSATRWIDEYRTSYQCPSLEAGQPNYFVPDMQPYAYRNPQRGYSPCNSATSPSQMSSSYSDGQSSPLSSPTPSLPSISPHLGDCEHVPFGYGGHPVSSEEHHGLGRPCVAMHDVQLYADTQPERDVFDDDQGRYYAYQLEEGYHEVQMDAEPAENLIPLYSTNGYEESHPHQAPNIRRRRPQASRSGSSPRGASRTNRRTSGSKHSPSNQTRATNDRRNGQKNSNSSCAFPCPFAIYGCSSTFGSKNEWKRHINTQHMRLGFWRCDMCDQGERKPNDFNRKDLFIQHFRRMHSDEENKKSAKAKSVPVKVAKNDPKEQEFAAAATRCLQRLRAPPAESGCLFCDQKFIGTGTWDERLEHIGRHMEHAKKDSSDSVDPKYWQRDLAMEAWLEREAIIVGSKDGYVLAEGRI